MDNDRKIRQLFADDGKVLACFFGHKHRSLWASYGGTHYITMTATHWRARFARVTVAEPLLIERGSVGKRITSYH